QLRHARSRLRSRLRAEYGAQDEDRRGPVEFIRLRRHQRNGHLPPIRRLSARSAAPLSEARSAIRELAVPGTVLRRLAARFPDRYPVLMDSAAVGPLSRQSILVAEPRAALWLDAEGRVRTEGVTLPDTGFLDALEQWWLAERVPWEPSMPAFAGGWALFLGYELAREIEPRLLLPPPSLPGQAFALRTACTIVPGLHWNRVYAVAERGSEHLLDRVAADAAEAARGEQSAPGRIRVASIEEEEPAAHLERVARAKEYIRA